MTYCIAIKLNAGLVMLSDSRTNAGVDHISTFRKMTVFEKKGNRVITLLSSGNLAITQMVRQRINQGFVDADGTERTIWNVKTMFDAAQLVGDAVRAVAEREAHALKAADVEFNISLLLGGQIGTEEPRLFHVYAAGNFIEAADENCYFQIGEAKYGKPIVDRVISPDGSLDEAAKCALISMDSTLKSNLSVGMPLDLLIYQTDALEVTHVTHIDEKNEYFQMIRNSWGQKLKQVFSEIPSPNWLPLQPSESHYKPLLETPQSFAPQTAVLTFQQLSLGEAVQQAQ
ncbi:MAG: proteasome-type protease [Cytophagales bacterium]|nr:proteasome-type protease [Cytophagales bacterium]